MEQVSIFIAGLGLVVACVAWWSVRRLRGELSRIAREQYYVDQKLRALPAKIDAAVEPLRIQTALLARGHRVSDSLIRTGQLYHELSGREAVELISNPSGNPPVFLLDVRTSAEYVKQRIPGARLIPVEDLENRHHTEIPPEVEKIVVYCGSGDRSRLACDFLSRQNYGNIYLLQNGLQGWSGPLEGDHSGTLIQISSKPKVSSHSPASISSSAQS